MTRPAFRARLETALAAMRGFPRRHPRTAIAAGAILGGLFWIAFVLPPRELFPAPRSTTLLDREGRLAGALAAPDGQWRLPPADSIPTRFRKALLAAEDRRFAWHPGIDPIAVLRAARADWRAGAIVQGGSTLTQQLARLSLAAQGPRPARGWFAKFHEALLAVSLELTHSKRTLLALYADNAPFGGNVVGLEAAAWRWYGRAPDELSWGECALLAALPNAPSRARPGRGEEALRARRDRILERLLVTGEIDTVERDLARCEPLPAVPRPLPRLAPHWLAFLARSGSGGRWRSGLDADLQNGTLRLAREHLGTLAPEGIEGLAVLVAEIPGGDSLPVIRAWIGDAAWRTNAPSGTDLALAPRSAGSTLKPFLYGMRLDQGAILPRQWIEDIPSRWGDFRPQNASGRFEGLVPADEALARSLNVPWARQLKDLGVEPFHALLRRAGFAHLFRPASDYGIALALGGGEVTLAELLTAYAGLDRGGVVVPTFLAEDRREGRLRTLGGPAGELLASASLREADLDAVRRSALPPNSERILSPGASWLALRALRRGGRIEEEESWKARAGNTPVAWKTGTSFGHRDAWAIGVLPRWVVAVWAGNPSGEGRPHLWGSEAAAPLLFRILPLLEGSDHPWPARPPNDLVPVPVCADTRARATPDCPAGGTDLAPPAGASAPPDRWHRRLSLDAAGRRVDAGCQNPADSRRVAVLSLGPALERFVKESRPGVLPRLPPWREGCRDEAPGDDLEILVPEAGSSLSLPLDLDGIPQPLVVEVRHRDPAAAVRCFLDQRDLGLSTRFHTFAVRPDPGLHLLTCLDDRGSIARSRFRTDWSDRSRPLSRAAASAD